MTCDTYNTYKYNNIRQHTKRKRSPGPWTYKSLFVENIIIMYKHNIIILHSKKSIIYMDVNKHYVKYCEYYVSAAKPLTKYNYKIVSKTLENETLYFLLYDFV